MKFWNITPTNRHCEFEEWLSFYPPESRILFVVKWLTALAVTGFYGLAFWGMISCWPDPELDPEDAAIGSLMVFTINLFIWGGWLSWLSKIVRNWLAER